MNMNQSPAEDTFASESILVCVSYGPSSERLIRRGAKLAQAFQAPLTILTVGVQDEDTYHEERDRNMALWTSLAQQLQAEFLISKRPSRDAAEVIIETARERKITQIVLGQSVRTKWEELTEDSIMNEILRSIELVDIHVVSVKRQVEQHEDDYEPGTKAYLVRDGDSYVLQFETSAADAIEGTFYQSVYTDFNNGIFKTIRGQEVIKYHIFDGAVTT
ncbi:UspA domain-containing protein [Paenibacillus algicola]|uniref:UspA domain-containing protein n=2 Tax=Paenibacillus algicola TaxID=2565926 RepID=A0A4V1G456_9BACL|nr:UspA domain-containing protein [Paenibacillus algicola]